MRARTIGMQDMLKGHVFCSLYCKTVLLSFDVMAVRPISCDVRLEHLELAFVKTCWISQNPAWNDVKANQILISWRDIGKYLIEISGLGDKVKWLALSNKIEETQCDIICLQETKKEIIDVSLIKKFCPKRINKFAYVPSVRASGGILIAWSDNIFHGEMVFAISVQFKSCHNASTWFLTNIYGPCQSEQRSEFLNWFADIQMPPEED